MRSNGPVDVAIILQIEVGAIGEALFRRALVGDGVLFLATA